MLKSESKPLIGKRLSRCVKSGARVLRFRGGRGSSGDAARPVRRLPAVARNDVPRARGLGPSVRAERYAER